MSTFLTAHRLPFSNIYLLHHGGQAIDATKEGKTLEEHSGHRQPERCWSRHWDSDASELPP
jgi:hypothetical protein